MIEQLTAITAEEQEILSGQKQIDASKYTSAKEFIIQAQNLVGKAPFSLRPHTRFIDFPEHGHDFMEFMYVIQGTITHCIDGEQVILHRGDILFLNKHIRHSVLRADQGDIGVNFIAPDSFLRVILHNVENNPVMRNFLAQNLSPEGQGEYLHFQTSKIYPIRNLLDNLIYAIVYPSRNDRAILTQLVSLLFTYLAHYEESLVGGKRTESPDALLRRETADYLKHNYPMATLGELAEQIGYTDEYLSRRIHELFGKPFRQLLLDERMKAAERMLRSTDLSIAEIISAVGYENHSHFYRTFLNTFGLTPQKYRKSIR